MSNFGILEDTEPEIFSKSRFDNSVIGIPNTKILYPAFDIRRDRDVLFNCTDAPIILVLQCIFLHSHIDKSIEDNKTIWPKG